MVLDKEMALESKRLRITDLKDTIMHDHSIIRIGLYEHKAFVYAVVFYISKCLKSSGKEEFRCI